MDYEAHWQALYNEMRTAMDVDHSSIAIYHTTSTDDQTGEPAAPPYVVYTDETNRHVGTMGGGNSKVLKSGFRITARHSELSEALSMISDALLYAVHLRIDWERSR